MRSFILCCVSETLINEAFLDDLKVFLKSKKIEIDSIHHLTKPHLKALDITLKYSETLSPESVKLDLMNISNKHQVDMALIAHDESRRDKKLIIFDMDSTLIQHEVIDEMAKIHGVGEKVKLITERAMNGELDFNEALTERVALLKGLKRSEMEGLLSNLKLTVGAEKLINVVKKAGYKTGIISGGFQFFADAFKERLGMDYAFSNNLEFHNDVLTGRVLGKIINAEEKARLLDVLAKKENINLSQVVAIGDGANDLLMLAKAGLGIAFHAKETVRLKAPHQMGHGPMTSILYFLGIPGDHFDEAL